MNKNLFILIAAFIVGLLVGVLIFSGEDNKKNSDASEETKENEIVELSKDIEQEGVDEIEPVISRDEAIKRLFAEKYNKKISAIAIDISKETENHLRGMVKFEDEEEPGNSGIFLAAMVYDNWELVFDGQGAIYCEEMEKYNFPEDMIEDCE